LIRENSMTRPKKNHRKMPAVATAEDRNEEVGTEDPPLPPGRWVAWDRERKHVLAVADTYPEVMEQVASVPDAVVEKSPGTHPLAAARPFTLLEWESPDIRADVAKVFADPELWLDTPHPSLGAQAPRALIGTDQERLVRYLLRDIVFGTPT
jgi:hypothetical protein